MYVKRNSKLNISDPKNRWQCLRQNFNKHDKQNNTNWLYYNDLLFLKPYIRHRRYIIFIFVCLYYIIVLETIEIFKEICGD